MQEIQFLQFTGGSNLMHAHSNYLICMCFIRVNTVMHIKIAMNITILFSDYSGVWISEGLLHTCVYNLSH